MRVHMSKEEQADKFYDIMFFRYCAFCHEAQEKKYHPKDGTPLPEADHHQTVRRTLDLLAENRRGARPGTSGSPGEDDLFVVDDELRRRVKWYYFDFWSKSEEVGGIRRDTCTDPGRAQKNKKKRKKKKKKKTKKRNAYTLIQGPGRRGRRRRRMRRRSRRRRMGSARRIGVGASSAISYA